MLQDLQENRRAGKERSTILAAKTLGSAASVRLFDDAVVKNLKQINEDVSTERELVNPKAMLDGLWETLQVGHKRHEH